MQGGSTLLPMLHPSWVHTRGLLGATCKEGPDAHPEAPICPFKYQTQVQQADTPFCVSMPLPCTCGHVRCNTATYGCTAVTGRVNEYSTLVQAHYPVTQAHIASFKHSVDNLHNCEKVLPRPYGTAYCNSAACRPCTSML